MKFLKYLLPLTLVTAGSILFADAGDPDTDLPGSYSTTKAEQEVDAAYVKDYINAKRKGSLADKSANLNLSADIRFEWDHMKCRSNGVKQRGTSTRGAYPNNLLPKMTKKEYNALPWSEKAKHRATTSKLKAPLPTNEFEVEANVMLDYATDNTWASMRIQMSNPAGLAEVDRQALINDAKDMLYGSGKMSNFALRKAYAGYNAWSEGNQRFDLEIGRRKLSDVFDSRVQFYSLFDGLLAKYAASFDGVTDFSATVAAFVVDMTVNHFGYVGELDFLNLGDSGVDFKYSYIHWDHHAKNRFSRHHPRGARFNNSQYTLGYTFNAEDPQLKTRLYGAYIHNHAADSLSYFHHKKANQAWYAGFTIGDAVKKGQWALDVCYQYVQAQAVSERDISGIAKDNPRNITLYNRRSQGYGNYKGYKVEGFYAFTDNWTWKASFEQVREAQRRIGGKHRSHQFALASIYAF